MIPRPRSSPICLATRWENSVYHSVIESEKESCRYEIKFIYLSRTVLALLLD